MQIRRDGTNHFGRHRISPWANGNDQITDV
jgi:hypothetical protein